MTSLYSTHLLRELVLVGKCLSTLRINTIMGKSRPPMCTAYGCKKRRRTKNEQKDNKRSDSDGSSDDETLLKRQYPRTFHR